MLQEWCQIIGLSTHPLHLLPISAQVTLPSLNLQATERNIDTEYLRFHAETCDTDWNALRQNLPMTFVPDRDFFPLAVNQELS